ncbi:MAG: hypothetical protein GXO79_05570 [Chlorobi bacterium]|nr:hypothetical protein [Chlorobiota bacterium]
MSIILYIGIIIFAGFIFSELTNFIKLPKVTGYIIAGILLNPSLFNVIPESFLENTTPVINIALSFITFSVGGSLLFSELKIKGKSMITLTIFEAEFAFLFVTLSFLFLSYMFHMLDTTSFRVYLAFSLLLGVFATPTDPSATLAVINEYGAKGKVTNMVLGIAAFDDSIGLINYSIFSSVAILLMGGTSIGMASYFEPLYAIGGALLLGTIFGFFMNFITKFLNKETGGEIIIVVGALLLLCYGLAKLIKIDALLSNMVMGVVVVNYSKNQDRIFKILERYTDELIFLLFFTISGMHLNFGSVVASLPFILIFVIFRSLGKFSGIYFGGYFLKESKKIKKYTAGGLVPQGGIVIGLAFLMRTYPEFNSLSDIVISIILGATVIHEIIGPVISKFALKKAGEIAIDK